jgi:TRAP-type C4-dicarboxylate transport system permease small subunit
MMLAFTILVWFAWLTVGPVVKDYVEATKSLGVARIPMWIPRLFIPVGASMFALELLIEIIKKLLKPDKLAMEPEELPRV